MPQMTPGQARIIDPVLTQVARGYRNARFVGMKLFPYVPVGLRSGKIIQFGKEHFQLYQTARAPGANVVEVQIGYAGGPDYGLTDHSIAGKVPIENLEEGQNGPGIDLGKRAVFAVQNIIGQRLEYEQAMLARDASKYASTNKVTPSSDAKWSDPDSTPEKDMADFREIIRGKIGVYPNFLQLSATVFAALQAHPKIRENIKYTGRDIVTKELLAQFFQVAEVEVGGGVYADGAGVFHDLWGNDAVLAYTETSDLQNADTPSFGYTYRLNGYPIVEEPYYKKENKSWMYPVTDSVKPVIAGAEAGFLITDAVAAPESILEPGA